MRHMAVSFSQRLVVICLITCMVAVLAVESGQASSFTRPQAPGTNVSADITTDTTWTLAGSPYYINNHIAVNPGATLTIEPGVQVWFTGKYYIYIYSGGEIVAKGTPTQHISFGRYIDPVTGPSSRWIKFWFYANTSSYFRYVDISGGGSSASGDNTLIHFDGAGNHVINNCTFSDSQQMGIAASGSSLNVTVAGSQFSATGHYPLLADSGANVTVTGSHFDAGTRPAIYHRARTVPATISVASSNLLSQSPYDAISNGMLDVTCIDAQDNWWGDATGPFDNSAAADACGTLGNGGQGSNVDDGVDYTNWRTTQAPVVGITTAPVASFSISPDQNTPQPLSTNYTFDASASSDAEDYLSSLRFRWDWDNDIVWDTGYLSNPVAQHTFSTGGWHTVRLQVTDTDGQTNVMMQMLLVGNPPEPAFSYTLPQWFQAVFDASLSSDVEDATSELAARWDWDSDGVWDTSWFTATEIQTHTFSHIGRYYPVLVVKDTDGLEATTNGPVDIVPLAATATIYEPGGTLTSTDGTVHVSLFTDTVTGGELSGGIVITLTPWITAPYAGLPDYFTYQGFNLSARSLGSGQAITQISGTYTVAVSYDLAYLMDVLRLPAFEDQLALYRWSGSAWSPTSYTVDTIGSEMLAATSYMGDFGLVMEIDRIFLPVVLKSN